MHKITSVLFKKKSYKCSTAERSVLYLSPLNKTMLFSLTGILETFRPIDGSEVDGFHPASGSQMLEVSLLSHRGPWKHDTGKKRQKSPTSSSYCLQGETRGGRCLLESRMDADRHVKMKKSGRETHKHRGKKSVISTNYMVCQWKDAALISLWDG